MIKLDGSEKFPHPEAQIVGRPSPYGKDTVTVVPTDVADNNIIVSYLSSHGLRVVESPGGLQANGSIAQLEEAFSVRLYRAVLPDGTHFRSRVGPGVRETHISIADEADGHILAVLGLDNRPFAKPYNHRIHPDNADPRAAHTPEEASAAYGFPSVSGAGHTVGIGSLGGGVLTSDLTANGIDPSKVRFPLIDGGTNSPTGNPQTADGENILDLVTSLKGTQLNANMYCGANTDQAMYDMTATALADPNVDCMSWSWGAPISGWSGQAKQAWKQLLANAKKPVFAASGDGGVNDGTGSPVVDFPAACPFVVGVGGTLLEASESIWNDAGIGGGASGGGFSNEDPRPAWQLGNDGRRGVPDVVLIGAPTSGYGLVIGGKFAGLWGGTSAAAPMMARGYALSVAYLGRQIPSFLSFIYSHPETFNKVSPGIQGEYGIPGQAPGAGLGSPNLMKLLNIIQPVDPPVKVTASITMDPPNPVHPGDTVTLTANITGLPSGQGYICKWTNEDGTTVYPSSTNNQVMNFPNAGGFTFVCNILNPTTRALYANPSFIVVVSVANPNLGPLEQFGQFVIGSGTYIETTPNAAQVQAAELVRGAQAWMPYFKSVDDRISASAHEENIGPRAPEPPEV